MHRCVLCQQDIKAHSMFLLKTHYLSHLGLGNMLMEVGEGLEEGVRLRCPHLDCKAGDQAMKLVLLNKHLDRGHGVLRRLLEGCARMRCVATLVYEGEGW